MDAEQDGIIAWAREEFEGAELGDSRRNTRLIRMAARAAQRPGGRVSDVFVNDAERQGAYDFLENPNVDALEISVSMAAASICRTSGDAYAYVAVDGSSLTLTDTENKKNFGKIGPNACKGRGLKILHSYIVASDGTPCGPCAQAWWTRSTESIKHRRRSPQQRETRHWLDVISHSAELFDEHAEHTKPWFLLDREADSTLILRLLSDEKHLFTIRARADRRVKTAKGEPRRYLRDELPRAALLTTTHLDVPGRPGRRARRACLEVRVANIELDLVDHWTGKHYPRALHVVHVREVGTTPTGEKPIEWILYTNFVVQSIADAKLVVFGYAQRWAIETFHKTWKTGLCNVEDTQLRCKDHVIIWATILAAVAARIERLKHLARTDPDLPASSELSPTEIKALIYLKRKNKKRTETIPDTTPSMASAVLWLAQMGGYTGKSSGGPPGSITIARGLEHLRIVAEVFADFDPG